MLTQTPLCCIPTVPQLWQVWALQVRYASQASFSNQILELWCFNLQKADFQNKTNSVQTRWFLSWTQQQIDIIRRVRPKTCTTRLDFLSGFTLEFLSYIAGSPLTGKNHHSNLYRMANLFQRKLGSGWEINKYKSTTSWPICSLGKCSLRRSCWSLCMDRERNIKGRRVFYDRCNPFDVTDDILYQRYRYSLDGLMDCICKLMEPYVTNWSNVVNSTHFM